MHLSSDVLPRPTAKLAKHKGFTHRPVRANQLAQWLRKFHDLHVNVQHNMHYAWQVQVQDIKGYDGTERTIDGMWLANDYPTYEEALEAGLLHALTQLPASHA
jgi:hypothetical protein